MLGDGRVAHTLRRDHYEKLIAPRWIAKVLVVLVLPPDVARWITHGPEELILRRCAWWKRMTGEAPIPAAHTEDHVTVHLPAARYFSPAALRQTMERVGQGAMP